MDTGIFQAGGMPVLTGMLGFREESQSITLCDFFIILPLFPAVFTVECNMDWLFRNQPGEFFHIIPL